MKVTIILEPLDTESFSINIPRDRTYFNQIGKKEFSFDMYAYSGENINISVASIREEIQRLQDDIKRSKEKLGKLGVKIND